MDRAQTESKTFEYPDYFDPDKLLDCAFGVTFNDPINIKIRFSPDQAKYIRERRWTKKQKISDSPDGSIILEMDTSGWWEVMRWVLSFGSDAEVLEPLGLREDINQAIHQLVQVYDKQPC